jgi:hypothetical protein
VAAQIRNRGVLEQRGPDLDVQDVPAKLDNLDGQQGEWPPCSKKFPCK